MLTLLGCTTGGEDWIEIHRRSPESRCLFHVAWTKR